MLTDDFYRSFPDFSFQKLFGFENFHENIVEVLNISRLMDKRMNFIVEYKDHLPLSNCAEVCNLSPPAKLIPAK